MKLLGSFDRTWNITWIHVTWTSLRYWSRFEQKNQNKAIQYWWSDLKSHEFSIPSSLHLDNLLVLKHLNFLENRYFKSCSSLYQSWRALPLPIFIINSQNSWWVYKGSCTTTIKSCHCLFLTGLCNRTKWTIFRKRFWVLWVLHCIGDIATLFKQTASGMEYCSTFPEAPAAKDAER